MWMMREEDAAGRTSEAGTLVPVCWRDMRGRDRPTTAGRAMHTRLGGVMVESRGHCKSGRLGSAPTASGGVEEPRHHWRRQRRCEQPETHQVDGIGPQLSQGGERSLAPATHGHGGGHGARSRARRRSCQAVTAEVPECSIRCHQEREKPPEAAREEGGQRGLEEEEREKKEESRGHRLV